MENEARKYYNNILSKSNILLTSLNRKITLIGTLRLFIFVATIVGIWITWGNTSLIVGMFVTGFILFLVMIKVHEKYFNMREFINSKCEIAKDNINRLDLNLKDAPKGEKYVDTHHQYSYDLDIFGKNSLFSLLDTTCTQRGSNMLASWLEFPLRVKDKIITNQEAIKELSTLNDFRTDFRAFGMANKNSKSIDLNNDTHSFKTSLWIKQLIYIFPLTMLASIILAITGMIATSYIGWIFVIGVIISGTGAKRTSAKHHELEKTVESLSSLYNLITLVENQEFSTSLLQNLKQQFQSSTGSASIASRKLGKILSNFDQRYNAISFLILNGFLLWDYRQLRNAEKWMDKFGNQLPKWNSTLSEFDTLSALATFSFNNPEYVFPTLDKSGEIIMEATNLGHPLIPYSKCVCNDVEIMKDGTFQVITGANMAGKSTYLRTVGVNYILAMIGAPVFATAMTFTPVEMLTGLRTTDSLQDNESYFFAELKRIQSIIQRAEKGERMMVILDEILKGTNSTDKQKGSLALVSKLVTMRVAGIIATHDLMLGNLANEFPNHISNHRFEATINNDNLTFSYKIHPGIAQNMNAYFLMKKMGII